MKKGYTKGYTIYWYNSTRSKSGYISYTTYSKERAVELFKKEYDEDYIITHIHV